MRIKKEFLEMGEEIKYVVYDDKKYLLTDEKIEVGDYFYSSMGGGICLYLNDDYGMFDPNIMKFPKATLIE